MEIRLDTEVLEKIEKDLAYNLEYLDAIKLFLHTMGNEALVEFEGEGVNQLIEVIAEFIKLLDEKANNMYNEFGNELGIIRRDFQELDKEIAATIEQAK